jgi:predicted component of type VI protein secretion system
VEAVLVMLSSGVAGDPRTFPVQKETITIGRREDCDLRIPLANVSRAHCKVVKDDANGAIRVEDLGSSNGTLVNGSRVQVSALAAGDIITVGPVRLGVQLDGLPTAAELQAAAAKPAAAPARAAAPAKSRPAKPKAFEDEIDAILAGDNDDSGADIQIDFEDKK